LGVFPLKIPTLIFPVPSTEDNEEFSGEKGQWMWDYTEGFNKVAIFEKKPQFYIN
jgi:hypothetical protein